MRRPAARRAPACLRAFEPPAGSRVLEPQPTIAERFVWSIWTAFGGCDGKIPNGLPNMNGRNHRAALSGAPWSSEWPMEVPGAATCGL